MIWVQALIGAAMIVGVLGFLSDELRARRAVQPPAPFPGLIIAAYLVPVVGAAIAAIWAALSQYI